MSFADKTLPDIPYSEIPWHEGIEHSVIINAPIEKVWAYVSDSSKATEWSVYFSHISPMSSSPKTEHQSDGAVGSLRRCFRDPREKTLAWDEVVLSVSPLRERLIRTFNLRSYWPQSVTRNTNYFVRQRFTQLDEGHTQLSFSTVVSPHDSILSRALFHLGKSYGLEIFKMNLVNIKNAIEGQPRSFPYDPFPRNLAERIFSSIN